MNFEEKQQIQWWLDRDPLTEEEKQLLFKLKPNNIIQTDESEYNKLCDKYFNIMPFCNISSITHTIKCDESATNFINKLFLSKLCFSAAPNSIVINFISSSIIIYNTLKC